MGKKSKTLKIKMVSIYWLEFIKNIFNVIIYIFAGFILYYSNVMPLVKEVATVGVSFISKKIMRGGGSDPVQINKEKSLNLNGLSIFSEDTFSAPSGVPEGMSMSQSTTQSIGDVQQSSSSKLNLPAATTAAAMKIPATMAAAMKIPATTAAALPADVANVLTRTLPSADMTRNIAKVAGLDGEIPKLDGIIPDSGGIQNMPNMVGDFAKQSGSMTGLMGKIANHTPSSILTSPPMMPYGYMLMVLLFVVSSLIASVVYFLRQNIEYETLGDKKLWKKATLMVIGKDAVYKFVVLFMILFPILLIISTVIKAINPLSDDLTFIIRIAQAVTLIGFILTFIILYYV